MILMLLAWAGLALAGTFGRVAAFGGLGTGTGQFTAGLPIVGAAVDPTGALVFVADINADRVQAFNANGAFAFKFGTSGKGDGQLNTPCGLAVNATNVFVCDYGNRRIEVFDLTGNYTGQFAPPETALAANWYPQQIAQNPLDSKLYVLANYSGFRPVDVGGGVLKDVYEQKNVISIFSASGSYLTTFDTATKLPIQSSLTIGADGMPWVHTAGSTLALQYSASGAVLTSLDVTTGYSGVIVPACILRPTGTVFPAGVLITSYQYAGPMSVRVGTDLRDITTSAAVRLTGANLPDTSCSTMAFDPTQNRLYLVGFDNVVRAVTYTP